MEISLYYKISHDCHHRLQVPQSFDFWKCLLTDNVLYLFHFSHSAYESQLFLSMNLIVFNHFFFLSSQSCASFNGNVENAFQVQRSQRFHKHSWLTELNWWGFVFIFLLSMWFHDYFYKKTLIMKPSVLFLLLFYKGRLSAFKETQGLNT